jgi:hypothetical protein
MLISALIKRWDIKLCLKGADEGVTELLVEAKLYHELDWRDKTVGVLNKVHPWVT